MNHPENMDILTIALDRRVANARALADLAPEIQAAADLIIDALRSGNQVLLFGNGGSAADSQHIAAELVGRFVRERQPLSAFALTTDTSILSAVANDYGYDQVFARQVMAAGRPGDVAIGLSTSGQSPNVLAGVQVAVGMGLRTIGLTGKDGGSLASLVDVALVVREKETSLIQESHIAIGHIICELIDETYCPAEQPIQGPMIGGTT